jgi:hypothetical protein
MQIRNLNNDEKPVFKVQGIVTVDGQPVPEIQVALHPVNPVNDNKPTFPQGFTDAEGKIRISTYAEGDGAPEGEYKVTFILQDYNIMGRTFSGPDKLKKKYADPKTTPFTLTLAPGKPNDLGKVELTAK